MPPTTYAGLVNEVINIVNLAIPALFGFLFLYFMWKMIDTWILHAGDPNQIDDGKKYAMAAVVVFVLAIITYGLIRLIRNSLFGV
ncbi:MAG: hypothetical protein KC877_04755 [Candidatus Kaiserbacteria bacterium]|nr:hypothetical protein [Candidatus Kaiserbacteria bacterium]